MCAHMQRANVCICAMCALYLSQVQGQDNVCKLNYTFQTCTYLLKSKTTSTLFHKLHKIYFSSLWQKKYDLNIFYVEMNLLLEMQERNVLHLFLWCFCSYCYNKRIEPFPIYEHYLSIIHLMTLNTFRWQQIPPVNPWYSSTVIWNAF